jgi:Nucleotidyl transferase AbiEii toxin, Type IV TA system
LLRRPTEDIDLFTDVDDGVRTMTKRLPEEFSAAGFRIDVVGEPSGLVDLFEGFDDAFVEFDVWRDDRIVRLSLSRLDRRHAPLILDIGPVMHMDDLMGAKTCALATRAEVRDYIDVAAALGRYTREQLLALALAQDRGLGGDDFAAAMRRLDAMPDDVFAVYRLDAAGIATLRAASVPGLGSDRRSSIAC